MISLLSSGKNPPDRRVKTNQHCPCWFRRTWEDSGKSGKTTQSGGRITIQSPLVWILNFDDRLDILENTMDARKLMILHLECVPHSDLLLQVGATRKACRKFYQELSLKGRMYVGLHLYEHDDRWGTCHPKCFVASSVSRDRVLPEHFGCWSCYSDDGRKSILKPSWPDLKPFTWHWYKSHCSPQIWMWQKVADRPARNPAGNLGFEDFLGPKSLPDNKHEPHNQEIHGPPQSTFCQSLCLPRQPRLVLPVFSKLKVRLSSSGLLEQRQVHRLWLAAVGTDSPVRVYQRKHPCCQSQCNSCKCGNAS